MVYDWKTHHLQNQQMSSDQKKIARAEALHSALSKELAVRQDAERVYREWLALKREEKQWQVHEARRSMYQGMLPPLWHPPREQLAVKEQGWDGSLQATVPLGRTKHIKRPGRIANL